MNITKETQNNKLVVRILLIIGIAIVCSQRVFESIVIFLALETGLRTLVDVVLYTIGILIITGILIKVINSHKEEKLVKPILAIICLIISGVILIFFLFSYYSERIYYYIGFIIFGLFLALFFLFTSLYLNQIRIKATWKTPLFISTITLLVIIIGQLINYIIISVYSLEIYYPSKACFSSSIISGIFSIISIVAFVGLYLEIMKSLRDKRETKIIDESKSEEHDLRVINQKANTSILIASILLLIYQIGYIAIPALNVGYLVGSQGEWSLFVLELYKMYCIFVPATVFLLCSMIQIWIVLKKITDDKNKPKIRAVKILALLQTLNPVLLDSIVMVSFERAPYIRSYLLTGVYTDIIFSVNGLIFIALIILLAFIQIEGRERGKIKIIEIIGSILLIVSYIAWIIVIIYKQLKLFPIPDFIGTFDHYFNKTRMFSNYMHMVFGICGFIMILGILIKSIRNRKKLSIKS